MGQQTQEDGSSSTQTRPENKQTGTPGPFAKPTPGVATWSQECQSGARKLSCQEALCARPRQSLWRMSTPQPTIGAWRFTYTRASHQKRSLSSGSGRRHAWTSRPTGRYRNLGSLFGFCYGATAHTLLVSYSSQVVAVLIGGVFGAVKRLNSLK